MSKPNELDEGLILVDDLSFFSPYAMGPRFEIYSAESDSSLEGFWITSSDSRGEINRRPVTGIDLTDWDTYTIFWEEGNATFLVDGTRVGELLSPAGDVSSEQALPGGMGASVYLENTIYSPENEDQASFDCLDSLLRDFQDGASRLGSQVPSFRYGAADLEDDRWVEIDYVSFFGMPEQAALIGGGFIADPHLESVITETLGVSRGLSREDMLSLTTLSAWSRGITSLGGLEYASNLEELSLPNNSITEISPLSGLSKLGSLRLDGNGIDDISPLEGLGSLKTLHIDTEYMDDLSPISSMTGLEELTVGWSARFDLSLLTDLTSLRMLKLSHDDVFDLSPLSNLANLRELWILGNRILDLSPLIRLERLEKLVLSEGYESLPSGSPAWPDISTLNETGVIVQFTGC